MSNLLSLLAGTLVISGLIVLGWWLLIETEGTYLGQRVVVWLYDVYANRYDSIKRFRSEYDHMFLAQPVMAAMNPHRSPLVLDVATGTARFPAALLRHAHFQGRIVGVDLSRKMLGRAARKISDERVTFMWCPAEYLPFPDNTFDVVACLEALEFMSSPEKVVAELARVLRPGGVLMMTNRINTRYMPGKTWMRDQVEAILSEQGIPESRVERWQVDYDLVWGRKDRDSSPTGARPLAEIFRCPCCGEHLMEDHGRWWGCPNCRFKTPVSANGIIQAFPNEDAPCQRA